MVKTKMKKIINAKKQKKELRNKANSLFRSLSQSQQSCEILNSSLQHASLRIKKSNHSKAEGFSTKFFNKNAQIIGQVAMFILAGIIFVLIITYGYKAITQFLGKSEEVSLATFQNDLLTATETIKRDYGSVSKLELTLPAKYTMFCIADSDTNAPNAEFKTKYPRLYDSWKTGSQNIFLIPPPTATMRKQIEDITIPNSYFCIKNTGKINLRLEGMGDKTQLTLWQNE